MSRDDWHTELRSRGYRLTPQRQMVLDAVRDLGHSTPDEIASAVRQQAPIYVVKEVWDELKDMTNVLEELRDKGMELEGGD